MKEASDNVIIAVVQRNLKDYYSVNCEIMANYWTGRLNSVSVKESFVSLQVEELTVYAKTTGVLVKDYESLFEGYNHHQYKRVVIQGEPGCGKTTMLIKWF